MLWRKQDGRVASVRLVMAMAHLGWNAGGETFDGIGAQGGRNVLADGYGRKESAWSERRAWRRRPTAGFGVEDKQLFTMVSSPT